MDYTFLLQLGLIAITTKVFAVIVKKIHLPQVVGFLLAGLVLGPAVLNIVTINDFLSKLSELGVVMILFLAGIGTKINDLRKAGKSGFLVALCGVLIPMFLGAVLALISEKCGLIPKSGLLSAVFIGTILTATSVSITVETLKELGKLHTEVGNTILAAALIDDVLGLIALTLVAGFAGENTNIAIVILKIVLFFVFAFVVGFAMSKFICYLDNHGDNIKGLRRYPILSFALCLFMAYAAEELFGVADIIGAYAAGVAISCTPKADYVETRFEPVNYILLTPVFFVCVGLKANIDALNWQLLLFSVLLLIVAIGSKLIGCGLGARFCGFDLKDDARIGFGMACRGEVALIVASRGVSLGVLKEELMTPVVITVVGCAILTPILLKLSFKNAVDTEQETELTAHAELGEKLDAAEEQLLSKK